MVEFKIWISFYKKKGAEFKSSFFETLGKGKILSFILNNRSIQLMCIGPKS